MNQWGQSLMYMGFCPSLHGIAEKHTRTTICDVVSPLMFQ